MAWNFSASITLKQPQSDPNENPHEYILIYYLQHASALWLFRRNTMYGDNKFSAYT